jgi:hypothetical protein
MLHPSWLVRVGAPAGTPTRRAFGFASHAAMLPPVSCLPASSAAFAALCLPLPRRWRWCASARGAAPQSANSRPCSPCSGVMWPLASRSVPRLRVTFSPSWKIVLRPSFCCRRCSSPCAIKAKAARARLSRKGCFRGRQRQRGEEACVASCKRGGQTSVSDRCELRAVQAQRGRSKSCRCRCCCERRPAVVHAAAAGGCGSAALVLAAARPPPRSRRHGGVRAALWRGR